VGERDPLDLKPFLDRQTAGQSPALYLTSGGEAGEQ